MPKYNTPIDYTIYEKEVAKMYNASNTLQGRVLISLCWITGARTSELVELKKEDILYNDDFVVISIKTLKLGDRDKGRFKLRHRNLRFTRPTNPRNIYLETIVKWANMLEDGQTLIKYKQRWCIKKLHKIGQKALDKDISVYHFRHSLCTQLAMNGASIPEIMYFKGAISLNGVTPYIHAKPTIFKLEHFNREKGLTLGDKNGANLFRLDEEGFNAIIEQNKKN